MAGAGGQTTTRDEGAAMLLSLLVASQPASPNPADNGIGIKPPMGCAYLPCLPLSDPWRGGSVWC